MSTQPRLFVLVGGSFFQPAVTPWPAIPMSPSSSIRASPTPVSTVTTTFTRVLTVTATRTGILLRVASTSTILARLGPSLPIPLPPPALGITTPTLVLRPTTPIRQLLGTKLHMASRMFSNPWLPARLPRLPRPYLACPHRHRRCIRRPHRRSSRPSRTPQRCPLPLRQCLPKRPRTIRAPRPHRCPLRSRLLSPRRSRRRFRPSWRTTGPSLLETRRLKRTSTPGGSSRRGSPLRCTRRLSIS
mmetsp:Transcript_36728/g.98525  ORF Transcript_36728/g.98525 Transcript_36728/m.98525 type:complete len:244 (+) Transcript_36728:189-920(+)